MHSIERFNKDWIPQFFSSTTRNSTTFHRSFLLFVDIYRSPVCIAMVVLYRVAVCQVQRVYMNWMWKSFSLCFGCDIYLLSMQLSNATEYKDHWMGESILHFLFDIYRFCAYACAIYSHIWDVVRVVSLLEQRKYFHQFHLPPPPSSFKVALNIYGHIH